LQLQGLIGTFSKTKSINPKIPTIGILRLSAIGDVTNALAAVTAIKKHEAEKQLIWFVGKTEYELLKQIKDIHFEIINKKKPFKEFLRLKKKFKNIEFESLLHMQRSIRCSLLSLALKSKRVIGFDKKRAKEFQSLFTKEAIETPKSAHAVDVFMEFAYKISVPKTQQPEWDFGATKQQLDEAIKNLKLPQKFISIVIAGSQEDRSWSHLNNAKVIEWIYVHTKLDVVLLGGPSEFEEQQKDKILNTLKASKHRCDLKVKNLVGKTNLLQLLSVIKNSNLIISPDTGPTHIASALNTKTIGLYVHMPKEITGPYNFLDTTVDKYSDAMKKYYNLKTQVKTKTEGMNHYDGIPKRLKNKPYALNLIEPKDVIEILSKELDDNLAKTQNKFVKKEIDL